MSILEITDRRTELKEALHRKIEGISDFGTLEDVQWCMDGILNNEEIYVHTPEERATVEQSLRELDAGLGISLEDVVREINQDMEERMVVIGKNP